MPTVPTETERLLSQLEAAPHQLAALTNAIENAQLSAKADLESWSANEILAHLRVCAEVWGKSINAMITQDHPTLRYVSPRTWMKKKNYHNEEFQRSLHAFTQQRHELVVSLRGLQAEDWARGATFTGTTRGREQTILSYAQRIVAHETEHLEQLEAMVKNVSYPNTIFLEQIDELSNTTIDHVV